LWGSFKYFITSTIFFMVGIVSPSPNSQLLGPLPADCPRVLIQNIRSYPTYLEALSSICNLRMHHAVVTRDPLNVGYTNTYNTRHSSY
jgi:hypothetical protein